MLNGQFRNQRRRRLYTCLAAPLATALVLVASLLLWQEKATAASPQAGPVPLVVAAAADLGPALRELGEIFQKRTGQAIAPVFGSSGNLAAQVRNGAPFDLFLSADMQYARQLESSGLAESLYCYAIGKLVVWVPASTSVSLDRDGLRALLDPKVRRIAVANPLHAPYGRAAVAAMKSANVYADLEPKLVFGENVSQAAEFVSSGNAQAGFIPLSLALSPGLTGKGRYWLVSQSLYPAIEQGAVVVKSTKQRRPAEAFLNFLKSPESTAVLRRYGFEVPEAK